MKLQGALSGCGLGRRPTRGMLLALLAVILVVVLLLTRTANEPRFEHYSGRHQRDPEYMHIIIPRTSRTLLTASDNTICPLQLQPNKSVISMSLYGNKARYVVGAVRNAALVKTVFPCWKLRIYTEMPGSGERLASIPEEVLSTLVELGAELVFMNSHTSAVPPMMWRFLVADDDQVERFLIRDSDSRLSERDAAAVMAWILSGAVFHCIRDHPSHAKFPVSGGLWGAVSKELRVLTGRFMKDYIENRDGGYLEDMRLLVKQIWPKVQNSAYCSDSVSCQDYPNSFPFPVHRTNMEVVGAVYDEHDVPREEDTRILVANGENKNCLPSGFSRRDRN